MEEKKIFVNDEGTAVFTCPTCNASKSNDVTKLLKLEKAVRVRCRCSCGTRYTAILERRKYFRKPVHLSGRYYTRDQKKKGPVTVIDISRVGLKLRLWAPSGLKTGDRIIVEFQLDDKNRTDIKKELVIRSMSGDQLGAEFYSIDPANVYDKALGFYLM